MMELREKLNNNKISQVQSWNVNVNGAILDHESRLEIIERLVNLQIEAAEQARIDRVNLEQPPTPVNDCPKKKPKPIPVIERFVRWGYDPDPHQQVVPTCTAFHRRKVGDVVAVKFEGDRSIFDNLAFGEWSSPRPEIGQWAIKLPTNTTPQGSRIFSMPDSLYQALKSNGCFGGQVKQ